MTAMTLRAQPRWKEIIVLSDEVGRTFTIDCGWGVSPPRAYVPSRSAWRRCTPDWLWDRREEVVELLRSVDHVVEEGDYPVLNPHAS